MTAQAWRTGEGRWRFQHGPIDLVLAFYGSDDECEMGAPLNRFVPLRLEAMTAHHAEEILRSKSHPPQKETIAEKIEAEFLGRAIGDVAGIGLTSLVRRVGSLDNPHGQSQ